MKQVLQSLRTGHVEVIEAPDPNVRTNHVVIDTNRTLISAGTERMLLEFGRGNLIQKALQQPDKVRQTIEKARNDGFLSTFEAVQSKLDQPIPLGYCNVGVVSAVGSGVTHVKPGDRVVSNGPHASQVVIGKNLVAKVPDSVPDESAAFVPLAAIGLQGCRLAQPTLGETVCVIGLGLIGLLTVQLLKSHGCRVIGVDYSADRLKLAESWGAVAVNLANDENPVDVAMSVTAGAGVDAVLITAATDSNTPVTQAANMCRKRGRIVLVGVTGLTLSRDDFYEKELSFQVSCSYGPGRYDPVYEEDGFDYPRGLVRWTEQRNFEAVLAEMEAGRVDTGALVSETVSIDDAPQAYERLLDKNASDLGLLLSFSDTPASGATVALAPSENGPATDVPIVALIGAGSFSQQVTAPALKASGAILHTVASRGGVSSALTGRAIGFQQATSDTASIFESDAIDTVVITTRHDSHADLALQAIKADKHVFVEKPLALSEADIDQIETALAEAPNPSPRLMVGFNRRFSPYAVRMHDLLATVSEPKCLVVTVNAGAIPADHWTQDLIQGGGRIIGEGCHFIDLMRYLVGAPIIDCDAVQIGRPGADGLASDKCTITLRFEDGSIGTLHYFANGPKALAKERIEVFAGGSYLQLDNFRALKAIGWPGAKSMKGRQDKGHKAAIQAFIDAIRSGVSTPIPESETIEVNRWTIRAAEKAMGKSGDGR